MNNDVWDIVPKPKGKSVVSSKWIYKIKHAADGSIEKYKARFVDRGFSHKEGIDYEETFAQVARCTSIKTVHGTCFHDEVGSTLDGCKGNLPEWCVLGRGLH